MLKQTHNKNTKPKNYMFSNKDGPIVNIIKTRQLEARSQVYKLQLPKKQKYDIFDMSLLEKNNTKKEQV